MTQENNQEKKATNRVALSNIIFDYWNMKGANYESLEQVYDRMDTAEWLEEISTLMMGMILEFKGFIEYQKQFIESAKEIHNTYSVPRWDIMTCFDNLVALVMKHKNITYADNPTEAKDVMRRLNNGLKHCGIDLSINEEVEPWQE